MGRRPQFAYVEAPAYVGFSVNIVQSNDTRGLSLPALTAVLNSRWAEEWFRSNAKWRGVALDISGTVLRDFPLPDLTTDAVEHLGELVLQRQSAPPVNWPLIEGEINTIVDRAYQICS